MFEVAETRILRLLSSNGVCRHPYPLSATSNILAADQPLASWGMPLTSKVVGKKYHVLVFYSESDSVNNSYQWKRPYICIAYGQVCSCSCSIGKRKHYVLILISTTSMTVID